MRAAYLNLSDIIVKRSRRLILHIDNLHIPAGQFIGIIGPNGAGKTTLLKLCCGLIKPNRGSVKLNDIDLTTLSGWRRSNMSKLIGYIPQVAEYSADLPFTLREVVAMGRTSVKPLLARLNRQDYDSVDYWLRDLGLATQADQTFRSLSGGEQQKALVTMAMVAEPAVLMLDEPGSNLDFNWRAQLTSIIERLYRQTKITILMVSHEISLLPSSCQRLLLMHQGNILADGPPEEVLSSAALDKAYQCRVKVVDINGQKYAISKNIE